MSGFVRSAIVGSIVVASLSALVLIANQAEVFGESTGMTRRRSPSVVSSETKVKNKLAEFVYGFRNGLPAIVLETYRPRRRRSGDLKQLAPPIEEHLGGFFQSFREPKDRPLLYMTEPVLTWKNDIATARCTLIWSAIDKAGRLHRVMAREEFILEPFDGEYRIVTMKTTPWVLKDFANPRSVMEKLQKLSTQYYDTLDESADN